MRPNGPWRRIVTGLTVSVLALAGAADIAAAASARTTSYHEATLTSSSKHSASYLGVTVAISGNTMVVGAPATVTGRGGGQGAIYLYSKPHHGGWVDAKETAELTAASDPATFGDGLGFGVAIAGGTVAAADPEADNGRGAVFIFTRGKRGWKSTSHPRATLTGRVADGVTQIGLSLAMTGSTVVTEALNSSGGTDGVVFARSRHGWVSTTDVALLTTPETPLTQAAAVAISGNTIAMSVVREDAAYVFTRGRGGWTSATPAAELTESNAASHDDAFGSTVAIDGSTVMVGAPGSDIEESGHIPGAVYEYARPADGWTSGSVIADTAVIRPVKDPVSSEFGEGLALDNKVLAVGEMSATVKGHRYAGDVTLFTNPSSGWSHAKETATVTAPRVRTGDGYGLAVAVSGTTVGVTSPYAAGNAGEAFVLTPR